MDSNALRAWAMVAIQGLLFLAVAVTAFAQDVGPVLFTSLWVGLALILVGSAGVIASGRDLGRALTPSPVPNRAGLAARGLYRYARHPMYTALVVICLGVAIGSGALLCYLSVVVLAVFFGFKARMEERYLRRVYNGYDAYAAHTGRFVPGIGRRKG